MLENLRLFGLGPFLLGLSIVWPSEKMNLSNCLTLCYSRKFFIWGESSKQERFTSSNSCEMFLNTGYIGGLLLAYIGTRQENTVNLGSLLVKNTSPSSFATISLLLASPMPMVRSFTFSKFCFALSSKNGWKRRFYRLGQIPWPVSTTCVSMMAPCL